MYSDSFAERQSLTQLYKEMGDQELSALDADFADLTSVAQEVLRDEMKLRGLSHESAAGSAVRLADYRPAPRHDFGAQSPIAADNAEDSDLPSEFTWKTPLCDCESGAYAAQLQAALKAEGIDSWLEGSGYQIAAESLNPRILVAADQLDLAREIASRPIPREIAELSKIDLPEYEPPVCPKCGAEDPLLESADPANSWLCEECGAQWTDPVEDPVEGTARRQ